MNDAQLLNRVLEFLEYPGGPAVSYNLRDDGQMFVRLGARRVELTDTDMVLCDGDDCVASFAKKPDYIDRACDFLAGIREGVTMPRPNIRTVCRIYSRDPEHYREDLAAALAVVMELNVGLRKHQTEVDKAVAQVNFPGPQLTMIHLRSLLGDQAFGIMTLFAMEAGTSLSGDAEALTWHMTGDQLDWPQDRLRERRDTLNTAWTESRLAMFDQAVAAYRAEHPDKVFRTCTVVGYWSGGKVVVTGVIDGNHDVWGGDDVTGEGLFSGTFTIDDNAADPKAELASAIAAHLVSDAKAVALP